MKMNVNTQSQRPRPRIRHCLSTQTPMNNNCIIVVEPVRRPKRSISTRLVRRKQFSQVDTATPSNYCCTGIATVTAFTALYMLLLLCSFADHQVSASTSTSPTTSADVLPVSSSTDSVRIKLDPDEQLVPTSRGLIRPPPPPPPPPPPVKASTRERKILEQPEHQAQEVNDLAKPSTLEGASELPTISSSTPSLHTSTPTSATTTATANPSSSRHHRSDPPKPPPPPPRRGSLPPTRYSTTFDSSKLDDHSKQMKSLLHPDDDDDNGSDNGRRTSIGSTAHSSSFDDDDEGKREQSFRRQLHQPPPPPPPPRTQTRPVIGNNNELAMNMKIEESKVTNKDDSFEGRPERKSGNNASSDSASANDRFPGHVANVDRTLHSIDPSSTPQSKAERRLDSSTKFTDPVSFDSGKPPPVPSRPKTPPGRQQQPSSDESLQNPTWQPGSSTTPNQDLQLQWKQQRQQQQQYRATRPLAVAKVYPNQSQNKSPSKPSSSSMPLSFKKIWCKVEDTLDKVASLEESVTDRAQSLAANVRSNFNPLPVSSGMSTESSNGSISRQLAREERRTWTSIRRQKQKGNIPRPTTETLRPYGQKFQIAREKNLQDKNFESGTGSKMNPMLLSKGGALSHRDERTSTSTPFYTGRDMSPSSPTSHQHDGGSPFQKASLPQQRPPPPPPHVPPTPSNQRVDGRLSQNGSQIRRDYVNNIPSLQQQQQYSSINASQPPGSRLSTTGFESPSRSSPSTPHSPSVQSTRPFVDQSSSEQSSKRTLKLKFPWKKLLPPNPFKLFRKKDDYNHASLYAWGVDDSDDDEELESGRGWFFGRIFRRKRRSNTTRGLSKSTSSSFSVGSSDGKDPMPLPISNILARSNNCQTTLLLTNDEKQKSRRIGSFHGLADVGILVLVLLGVQQIASLERSLLLPSSFEDLVSVTLPFLTSTFKEAVVSTWAPFAFLYAYLINYIRHALLIARAEQESFAVSNSVEEDSDYSQLYMMMVTALPIDATLPKRLAAVATRQFNSSVSKARLKTYTSTLVLALTLLASSFVGQTLMVLVATFVDIVLLNQWRSWPVQWLDAWDQIRPLLQSLLLSLKSQSQESIAYISSNPLKVAVPLSVFLSLIISSLLPSFEERRSIASHKHKDEDDEQEEDEILQSTQDNGEDLVRIGTSSASRLSMLPDSSSIEGVFERWYANRVTTNCEPTGSNSVSIQSILRFVSYVVFALVLSVAPILVSSFLGGATSMSSLQGAFLKRLDGLFNLSLLQLYLLVLSIQAGWNVIQSTERTTLVTRFLDEIRSARDEINAANNQQTDLKAIASTSSSAGLMVRDLWAAHTTKRVWAVRGANLECKNGEVVAVLGDEGEGRSKLLTTIAEAASSPPKRSLMTTKVRGTVSIGGVETSKWNRSSLKRRLGVFLSDVGFVSDWASLFSGWTIGEILQPVNVLGVSNGRGQRHSFINQHHKLTRTEKGSILLALKITGMYSVFQSNKLPSKLSTILTARESDLKHPGVKSQGSLLSPGEWSKLLLTRILAQVIHDNDNVLSTTGSNGERNLDNSLVGSVLLLDDLTAWLSEVEEATLLKNLRRTGSATVFSSNKWSTGRFADRIYVVKDGAIVEAGTHDELLMRGPQQSLYAAKWHAMSMV